MAKFKQGQSGNPNGRKKGAINKVAKPVKEQLSNFLNEKLSELPAIWNKLTPRDRAGFIKDMIPYFIPRMQSIEAYLEYDKLTDEGLKQIVTDILNNIENDTTN
ncbi:MAG: DUF5681 domain-containing protein [Bacteroidota bacterium]